MGTAKKENSSIPKKICLSPKKLPVSKRTKRKWGQEKKENSSIPKKFACPQKIICLSPFSFL